MSSTDSVSFWRRLPLLVLQVSVTGGLLWWIFREESTRAEVVEVFRNANPGWLVVGVVVAGVENLLGVLRWRIFLKLLGIQIGWWKSVQIYFLGLVFNMFMLGAVGGDAVKALVLIGQGHRHSAAFLSVILDRLSGLAAMILTSAIFIGWNYDWLTGSPVVAGVIHFVFVYLLVVCLVLGLSFWAAHTGFSTRIGRWIPAREKLAELCESYFLFVRHWRQTAMAALISVGILWLYFSLYYFAARAFSCPVDLLQILSFMPAVDIIAALPVSLGGVGVREQLFVTILGQLAGVPSGLAVSVAMAGYGMSAFWGVTGTLTLPFLRGLLQKGKAREEQRPKL